MTGIATEAAMRIRVYYEVRAIIRCVLLRQEFNAEGREDAENLAQALRDAGFQAECYRLQDTTNTERVKL